MRPPANSVCHVWELVQERSPQWERKKQARPLTSPLLSACYQAGVVGTAAGAAQMEHGPDPLFRPSSKGTCSRTPSMRSWRCSHHNLSNCPLPATSLFSDTVSAYDFYYPFCLNELLPNSWCKNKCLVISSPATLLGLDMPLMDNWGHRLSHLVCAGIWGKAGAETLLAPTFSKQGGHDQAGPGGLWGGSLVTRGMDKGVWMTWCQALALWGAPGNCSGKVFLAGGRWLSAACWLLGLGLG